MKELNNNQVLYIENDLKSKGLIQYGIKNEILDHICCMIELKMVDGLSFSEAFEDSLRAFEDEDFSTLKKTINHRNFKNRILHSKAITTGIAACIFMFVFVVDAQDRPDINPVEADSKITSTFGKRMHPTLKVVKKHNGVDIRVPVGTEIKATASGTVEKLVETAAYGKYIIIKHGEEYSTLYATLSEYKVVVGQNVQKGQVIALSGNSGISTAPHLHYEVIKKGEKVDPAEYFEGE